MIIKWNEVTWYSKLGAVILFILVVPVLTFYIGRKYQETITIINTTPVVGESPVPKTTQIKFSFSDPLNGTYIIDGEKITLRNGQYIENVGNLTVVPSEIHVFGELVTGDVSGDRKPDKVFFLYQESGGTGIFFYVVTAVAVEGGKYVGTDALFIGDRIAPKNITIKNGEALVNYAIRKEDEPLVAEPSVGVTKYLRVEGGKLKERVI